MSEAYDDIVDARGVAWNMSMAMPERIRSTAEREWASSVSPRVFFGPHNNRAAPL